MVACSSTTDYGFLGWYDWTLACRLNYKCILWYFCGITGCNTHMNYCCCWWKQSLPVFLFSQKRSRCTSKTEKRGIEIWTAPFMLGRGRPYLQQPALSNYFHPSCSSHLCLSQKASTSGVYPKLCEASTVRQRLLMIGLSPCQPLSTQLWIVAQKCCSFICNPCC